MLVVEMNKLNKLRKKIDKIDREIIQLLCRRVKISKNISYVKMKEKLAIVDEARERNILKRAGRFKKIFKAIIQYSRKVQRV